MLGHYFLLGIFGLLYRESHCLSRNQTGGPLLHEVSVGSSSSLLIGPLLTRNGHITLYTLDHEGVFHIMSEPSFQKTGEITYSVLKNGILVTTKGPYAIEYDITSRGDLVPKDTNKCIYKSDKAAFYLKGIRKMLIPVDVFYTGADIKYVYNKTHLLYTETLARNQKNANFQLKNVMSLKLSPETTNLIPDKSCNGDVTLFLLKSDGEFARNPPDEYLPDGMKVKYELKQNGCLTPQISKTPALKLTYSTSKNGNLKPCDNNTHVLTTMRETTKSFILGEGGVLAPVSELAGINKTINYFYDGRLIHSSNQFKRVYSNSSIVYVTEKTKDMDRDLDVIKPGPKFECSARRIEKRDTRHKYDSDEDIDKKHKPTTCGFAYDDKGKRISLEPLVNEFGKIALYKLTCKGHLKRMEAYKEPEFGFEVHFKFLDNSILVPNTKGTCKLLFKYILQENGNLAPVKHQKNTFKKAPASMLYYVLAKNKELIPVRLNILKDNHIDVYYQDCLIYTISPDNAKHLEVFTTLYVPLYAYLNGRVLIIYHDPLPKPVTGATWKNPNKSCENKDFPTKNLYLIGPDKTKIKIEPEINKNGVPEIYEMDWNGVCHKSPKDDNKNMILRSYKLLKEGILIRTNESNCYIFLVTKNGDMMPYCYPESKLRAPHGLTVKYLVCKHGVLLPVLVEAPVDHIRFSYESTVVYCKRAHPALDEILELCKDNKVVEKEEQKFHKDCDGNFVYFERKGDHFYRHPQQKIDSYFLNLAGFMKLLPNGVLEHTTYADSKDNTIQMQVGKNGDLTIISDCGKKPECDNYLLDEKYNLIPVEVKEKNGFIRFYQNGTRVGKQKKDDWKTDHTEKPTPSGKDPLGIFKDPKPEICTEKGPSQVQIPIEKCTEAAKQNPTTPKPKLTQDDKQKCEQIRKAIHDLIAKEPNMANMELEMDEHLMQEIYDTVCKCSKTKSKRDLTSHLLREIRSFDSTSKSSEEDTC